MNAHLIAFISFFVLCLFATLVVNVVVNRTKAKEKAKYFSKENLMEYEKVVSSFLQNHNIEEGMDIHDMVERLGYELKEVLKLRYNHEAEKDGNIIKVRKALGYRAKNFVVAHEVAHDIKGDEISVARDFHSFRRRSVNEQVCDYIAAALLLPLSEMQNELQNAGYEKRTKKERIRFIMTLAEKKNVSEEVVIRRIKEVKLLSSC